MQTTLLLMTSDGRNAELLSAAIIFERLLKVEMPVP